MLIFIFTKIQTIIPLIRHIVQITKFLLVIVWVLLNSLCTLLSTIYDRYKMLNGQILFLMEPLISLTTTTKTNPKGWGKTTDYKISLTMVTLGKSVGLGKTKKRRATDFTPWPLVDWFYFLVTSGRLTTQGVLTTILLECTELPWEDFLQSPLIHSPP